MVAAGLRFHLLGAQSLWNDEGSSYVQATRSLSDIAIHAARDIHPPGYYWLLSIWRTLTGDSEFALRSLSVFVSVLSVALTFALGKRLYNSAAGLLAAAFVTVNTFSIFYAQEARMYALLTLWGAAAMWAFLLFTQRPTPRRTLALAILNAAGLWTQYAYPFVMLTQGVLFVVWLIGEKTHRRGAEGQGNRGKTYHKGTKGQGYKENTLFFEWKSLIFYIAANVLTIALFAAWLPNALHQITSWPNTGEGAPYEQALSVIAGWLTFGLTYAVGGQTSWIAVAWFVLLFGLLIPRNDRRAGTRWALLVPVVWAVVSVGLFIAMGLFREGNLKLLLPAQIAVALWLARGIWVLATWDVGDARRSAAVRYAPRLAAIAGAFGLLVNMGADLNALYHDADFQRDDYRAIVSAITADATSNSAIVLDAPNQEEVFRYYYSADYPVYTLPPGLGGDDDETRAAVRQIIADYERVFVVFWGEAERDPNRVVETTLDAEAYEAGNTWYGDVRLARYVSPAELTETVEAGARFGDSIVLERYALSATTLAAGDVLQLRLDWHTDEALDTRYKVFVQLLAPDGLLAAQRDSEPGGGLALTTTWPAVDLILDRHALTIPHDLPASPHYSLIVGLYNLDDPQARLSVGDSDYLELAEIEIRADNQSTATQ
ncbi:MAG: glycosyltransferase family 39 protein [Burkholderiales bacterium]|nr:glycosyltransferase family 39 protein [Anaerolineae bacterium]